MPVHIDEMTSEVTAVDGEMPLSEAQLEALIERVLARLEERRRQEAMSREATRLRRSSAPPWGSEP